MTHTNLDLFFATDDALAARRAELMAADHSHRTAAELAALDHETANRAEESGVCLFETM